MVAVDTVSLSIGNEETLVKNLYEDLPGRGEKMFWRGYCHRVSRTRWVITWLRRVVDGGHVGERQYVGEKMGK